VSVIAKVIYDQLDHDSLVPTSLHLQLVDQSIRRPVGITVDIPVDFVVLTKWMVVIKYRSFLGGHS
jgi:hypothetical protein